MGGVSLPTLEQARERLVPAKLSEEQFREEVRACREKNPAAAEGVIAAMLLAKHEVISPLRGRRRESEVVCIHDAKPGDYVSIVVTLLRERRIKSKDDREFVVYTAVDQDYHVLSVFDWEGLLTMTGEYTTYHLQGALCRQGKYGDKVLSVNKVSEAAHLNGAFFKLPPTKRIAEIEDHEYVRVRGDAVFGSLRESEYGTVRLVMQDGERLVNLTLYPDVVDRLKDAMPDGDSYEELDRYSLEVVGIYREEEPRGSRFKDKNYIEVQSVRLLEKIWKEDPWSEERSAQNVEEEGRSSGTGSPAPATTPATSTENPDEIKDFLEIAFSVHTSWTRDDLLKLLSKKVGEERAAPLLDAAEKEGLIIQDSSGKFRLGRTGQGGQEQRAQEAAIKKVVAAYRPVIPELLKRMQEAEKLYGDGMTFKEVCDAVNELSIGGADESEVRALLEFLCSKGEVHEFDGKYRRV